MKKSVLNIFTIILLITIVSIIFLVSHIYLNPYSALNPFPPPTIPAKLSLPSSTPTLAKLPATWTVTPDLFVTPTIKPSSTPWPTTTKAPYIPGLFKSATPTPTSTKVPTNTSTATRTPTRTKTRTAVKTATSAAATNTTAPPTLIPTTATPTATSTATITTTTTSTGTATNTATATSTSTVTPTSEPTVPPNANIAFNMDYDGDGYQDLLLLTEDGSTIWTVLSGSSSQQPAFSDWSPDGQWLLYTDTSGIFSQLYRIKRDGSDNTYISRQGYSANSNGDYSPDSNTIVFQRSGSIYTVLTDGSASAVNTGFTGMWPRWSPDGSALIYYKTDNNLYSAAGGTETQLTNDADLQIHPSYIASDQITYSQSDGSQYDIYVADPSNIGSAVNLTNSGGNDTFPSLAPGNRIIYLIDNQNIAVMNLDGSSQITLYSGPRTLANPRWYTP